MNNDMINYQTEKHTDALFNQLEELSFISVNRYYSQAQFTKDCLLSDDDSKINALDYNLLVKLHRLSNDSILRTFLFSLLVEPQNVTQIRTILIKLGSLINQMDHSHQWYLVFLDTPMKPYHLVNLFLTNNKQPQMVYLGTDCLVQLNITYQSYMSQHNDVANDYYPPITATRHEDIVTPETFEQLKHLTYIWQKDTAITTYLKQIKILDQKVDSNKLKQILKDWFNEAIIKTKADCDLHQKPLDHDIRSADQNLIEGGTEFITYLDLDYLCYVIRNKQSLQQTKQDAAIDLYKNFDTNKLTKTDKQELKPILIYLSQYLTN